jgi:hypothetical protein
LRFRAIIRLNRVESILNQSNGLRVFALRLQNVTMGIERLRHADLISKPDRHQPHKLKYHYCLIGFSNPAEIFCTLDI